MRHDGKSIVRNGFYHARRKEYALADKFGVILARCTLDNAANEHIAEGGVAELGTGVLPLEGRL